MSDTFAISGDLAAAVATIERCKDVHTQWIEHLGNLPWLPQRGDPRATSRTIKRSTMSTTTCSPSCVTPRRTTDMAAVTINATVDKHFSKGIRLAEKDGEHTRRWTIWTSERPTEGSTVTVTGDLRLKAAEYDGKHYVEASVNNATISAQNSAQGSAAAEDPWGTDPNAFDSSTPF